MARWLTRLRLRLRSLFRARAVERELHEELQYHLDREIEERRIAANATTLTTPAHEPENVNRGDQDAALQLEALQAMGAMAQSMEACRDARGVSLIEHGLQDVRFALRQLRKAPGFACTAVGVLALGIAATVAIFGFVEAALITPLPYADQARLVSVFTASPTGTRGMVSYLDIVDWQRLTHAFSGLDAYDVRDGFTVRAAAADGSRAPQRAGGLRVTAGFFRTLGVSPILGRDFRADEDQPAAPATVLLGYGAWQTRFGGRTDVLGEIVTLDDTPHVIIGVLPRSFYFAAAGTGEFWTTMRGTNGCWHVRGCHSLEAIGRLADGVSLNQAAADMDVVARQLQQQYPDSNHHVGAGAIGLREALVGEVRPILLVLLIGAGLLLLIACINVASLLFARSASRTREIAVRKALGASSGRLVAQFATEAMVLVAISTALGLIGATWGTRFLASLIPATMMTRMPYLQGLGLTSRAIAVACGVSLIAATLFTLMPVLRITATRGPGQADGLREGTRGSAGRTWRRVGAHLVVVELALAVILLVSAGLLGKSLYLMLQADTGFNPDRIVTIGVGLPSGALTAVQDAQITALSRQIVDRVASLPGVQAVGFTNLLPLTAGGAWPPLTSSFDIVGRPAQDDPYRATVRSVSAGFFAALQARLARGRYFTGTEDASKPPVAIINQTMATQLFPGEDPIGKQIVRLPMQPAHASIEIVGVVADLQEGSIETPARPAVYSPFAQRPDSSFALVVRLSSADLATLPALAAAIREVRADLSVSSAATMAGRISRLPSAYLGRSSAWLVGTFAAMALLLSVVGLYGVVSYSVGQRTREMGVRIALGAQSHAVYRLVLGEAAWLVGIGTALGLVCAIAAASLMRGLLFGVHSWDAPTLAAVAVVLIASALVASYIPARRAASVNPIDVLRAE
jgi:macrolide transport system ATP-binding/permease protein